MPNLISTKQTAMLLGVSQRYVQYLAKGGKIKSYIIGNSLGFEQNDVLEFVAKRNFRKKIEVNDGR